MDTMQQFLKKAKRSGCKPLILGEGECEDIMEEHHPCYEVVKFLDGYNSFICIDRGHSYWRGFKEHDALYRVESREVTTIQWEPILHG